MKKNTYKIINKLPLHFSLSTNKKLTPKFIQKTELLDFKTNFSNPYGKKNYGSMLLASQMIKHIYGIKTTNFLRSIIQKALVRKGNKELNLINLLSSKLDYILYINGYTKTIEESKQLITHGFVELYDPTKPNITKNIITIPSILLKPGQIIYINKKSNLINEQIYLNLYNKFSLYTRWKIFNTVQNYFSNYFFQKYLFNHTIKDLINLKKKLLKNNFNFINNLNHELDLSENLSIALQSKNNLTYEKLKYKFFLKKISQNLTINNWSKNIEEIDEDSVTSLKELSNFVYNNYLNSNQVNNETQKSERSNSKNYSNFFKSNLSIIDLFFYSKKNVFSHLCLDIQKNRGKGRSNTKNSVTNLFHFFNGLNAYAPRTTVSEIDRMGVRKTSTSNIHDNYSNMDNWDSSALSIHRVLREQDNTNRNDNEEYSRENQEVFGEEEVEIEEDDILNQMSLSVMSSWEEFNESYKSIENLYDNLINLEVVKSSNSNNDITNYLLNLNILSTQHLIEEYLADRSIYISNLLHYEEFKKSIYPNLISNSLVKKGYVSYPATLSIGFVGYKSISNGTKSLASLSMRGYFSGLRG